MLNMSVLVAVAFAVVECEHSRLTGDVGFPRELTHRYRALKACDHFWAN
uniref:Uncharacterized protein n=1 Tax=Anguilla anguilla TaxID=7936 RepID=A0A0E9TZS6_ANGAN